MNVIANDGTSIFSDDRIRLAAGNYEAQEWLFRELHKAYRMSGITIEDLATELAISTEDAQDWISGEVDLTLSELRQLANAIDAKVRYHVQAMRTLYDIRLQDMHHGHGWQHSTEPWSIARVES